MSNLKDALGDRMKAYEMAEAGRKAMVGIPLLVRLDGHGFHKYTKGLQRPYDERLSRCMIETTQMLVKETQALVGYTQSDEISLLYFADYNSPNFPPSYIYDGRFQKMTSLLAGKASSYFSRKAMEYLPEKNHMYPEFDCRAWQVPNRAEAANVFYWREQDATKNAISMAAHAYFSHKRLQNMSGAEKQEMLFSEKGINFNDYPVFFKRGTYVKRKTVKTHLSDEKWLAIPEKQRPESRDVFRTVLDEMDWPAAKHLANYADLLFDRDAEPKLKADVTA